MDIILDTQSCHYKTTWQMFLTDANITDTTNLPANLVLIDCNGLSTSKVNKKVKQYKGKTIFLVNASPNQAAGAAAIFYEYTPVSTIADVVKDFVMKRKAVDRRHPFELSSKEFSILKMVSRGLSNKEISKAMNLSLSATKYYLKKIYKKMNVSNRTEAALAGARIHL